MNQLIKYSFGVYRFTPEYIKKLTTILGSKELVVGDDIKYYQQVRVVDDQNKLIGVFQFDEAKKKAQKLNKEIIMINQEVSPALCRICDYSDELAQRFMSDILKKSDVKQKQEKQLRLGARISMQDLKMKAQQAQEIIKKQGKLKVQIICKVEDGLQSKNVLYTFRDLCLNFMSPQHDIKTRDVKPEEDSIKEEEDEQVILEQVYESLEKQKDQLQVSQSVLERQINQFYAKLINSQKYMSSDAAQELKQLKPQLYDDGELSGDEQEIIEQNDMIQKVISMQKSKKADQIIDQYDPELSKPSPAQINDYDKQMRLLYLLNQAQRLKK
ncbi:hypothetical protein pb186bvf_019402 [Paramecium bursaria]